MRCSRMRGYGSWSIGWREGERLPPQPPGRPPMFFYVLVAIVLIVCVRVAFETGNPMALLIGLGVLMGIMKS